MAISGLALLGKILIGGEGDPEDNNLLSAFRTPSLPSSDYLRDFLIVKSSLSVELPLAWN